MSRLRSARLCRAHFRVVRAGIAVVALVALASGCASWLGDADEAPVEAVPGRDGAETLPLGEWSRGVLHCGAGSCAHWYRFSVSAPGDLRIEIHAPTGPDVPDFDVRLEDEAGEVLWGFAPTGHSPRRIQRMLGPGDYYLLLDSIGENQGPLAFEAFARLEESGPVFRPSQPEGDPRGLRQLPHRPEFWMGAEIVQVEGQAGFPSVVVLNGGAKDDWSLGYRGELIEGDHVIGTFELVEVGEDRSRGRLDAAPSDAITFETRARVRVPLE